MSKTVLFYFTGTGNSLAVAKRIADGLSAAIVVPMLKGDAHTYINEETEKIGLIYPIYMNAVPRVVITFIKDLKLISGTYVFAIATHGGIPGMSGLYLDKVLKKYKINLDAYYEIKMINNTPKGVAPKLLMKLNWELDITTRKINNMLTEVNSSVENIANKITNRENTTFQDLTSISKRMSYWLMNLMWYISGKSTPKLNFLLDECCIGCGLCEKVCTTKRIKMNKDKPEWINENCNFCYACFNYCPVQAIGVKHYTKKLGRYHHPEIKAEDIAGQHK